MRASDPPPGSDEAIKAGCCCPRMSNGHGRGYMGGLKDESGETLYVMVDGCPIHQPARGTEATHAEQ